MENDVLDMLEDIGYKGELLNDEGLDKAIEAGPKSIAYTELVEWICKELKVLCKLEETVNSISSEDDTSNFLVELSSFLKELGCCYRSLIEGHLSERLNTKEKRLLLINYLLSELMAARMVRVNKPHLNKGLELKLEESSTAGDLKLLLMSLEFSKPPNNIVPGVLFSRAEKKIKEILKGTSPELLGNPLFKRKLSDKQWCALQEIQSELQNEYYVRREMLIKRLDVTIQSFQWSERAKSNENEIFAKFNCNRAKMFVKPNVTLADLLAAREDLAIIEKTSNASVRKNTQSSVNKVLIGRVPDRGGRPSEQAAPPPEMPNWQKDRAPGGGGARGRASGRVQGNWNPGIQRQDRGDCRGWNNSQVERGHYQDNRTGFQDNKGYNQDRRNNYNGNREGYKDRGGRHSGKGRDYR